MDEVFGKDKAHRPCRARPAAGRRHPRHAGRPLTLPDSGDSRHATPPASDSDDISDADLRIPPGGAPLPVTGGQPCPARIPPVTLSVAEALKITRLAERYAARLLTRARLAYHLRWSHWRRRHQARARWHHYSARLEPIAA